jgi:hypothetical protein
MSVFFEALFDSTELDGLAFTDHGHLVPSGAPTIDEQQIDFCNGRGYIAKRWGKALSDSRWRGWASAGLRPFFQNDRKGLLLTIADDGHIHRVADDSL